MRLRGTAPAELPALWRCIRDRIAGCCERSGGKYEPVDVLRNVLTGRMQLWLALDERSDSGEPPSEAAGIKALALTEIVSYPRLVVCKLLACTGEDAGRWIGLLAEIEVWAKERGCSVLEPICRPGWERRLKPIGYRKTHVVLEKSL